MVRLIYLLSRISSYLIYKTVGAKKYYDPEYSLGDTKMYISGGVGTSKYKVRLFDRPSISLYRLYSK